MNEYKWEQHKMNEKVNWLRARNTNDRMYIMTSAYLLPEIYFRLSMVSGHRIIDWVNGIKKVILLNIYVLIYLGEEDEKDCTI